MLASTRIWTTAVANRARAATKAAFFDNGYFRSGDLGYLDADGYLFIVDRKKDIIIRGGENISCPEVEAAIYEHPDANECAVFGLPDERLGEVVGAVIWMKPGSSVSAEDMSVFLGQRLAPYKVPSRIWMSNDALPKLGSEKTHLDLWFNYQLRTEDHFFGLGPRTPDNQETNYASDERSFNATLSHDLTKRLQVGLYARVANTNGYRGENKDDPPIDGTYTGRPPGKPGTVFNSTFLPGLNTNAKIFSYGVFAELDYRNNDAGLTKGGYAYARFASSDGLKNDIFDDFGWNEVELDGRVYIPLFSNSTSRSYICAAGTASISEQWA